jgi:hypothetical protein
MRPALYIRFHRENAHRAVSRFVESTCGAGVRPAMAVITRTFDKGLRKVFGN